MIGLVAVDLIFSVPVYVWFSWPFVLNHLLLGVIDFYTIMFLFSLRGKFQKEEEERLAAEVPVINVTIC